MTTVISMNQVRKSFVGRTVLEDVTWEVPEGAIYGLIGANAAGKTTLLRIALGVLWPDSGDVFVLGERLGRENAELRQRVHYVAADPPFSPRFRGEEWLRYVRNLYTNWDDGMSQRVVRALEIDVNCPLGQLSQGNQMSFQLAIAVSSRPDILLLDEPTNGLDLVVKRQITQLIMDMAAELGTTVVMATHDIDEIERMADTVGVLYGGRFILQDGVDAMKAHVHRLQVVMSRAWPDSLMRDDAIIHVDRQGKVGQITIAGDPSLLVSRLFEAGALLVDPIPMDLAETFRAVLEKEGYSREAIRWHAP